MWYRGIRLTLVMIVACATTSVVAQDLNVDWWTVDGGGEMFTTGGDYELSGTIGQPDANATVMAGGDHELAGVVVMVRRKAIAAVIPAPCQEEERQAKLAVDPHDALVVLALQVLIYATVITDDQGIAMDGQFVELPYRIGDAGIIRGERPQ